jgi:hypothetical protein
MSNPRSQSLRSAFEISKRLRIYFRFERHLLRRLLGELCRAAARTVITVYRAASHRPDAIQTAEHSELT